MDPELERARAEVARLVQQNPELSIGPEYERGTHRVLLGQYKGMPVVVKWFCVPERKEHEKTVLELFAPTGLVPKLYPVETDTILVMERLRGLTVHLTEGNLRRNQVERLYCQLGRAMARIAEAAPGSASGGQPNMISPPGYDYGFYCKADLPTFFDTVTERAAKVLAERDVPHKTLLGKSLSALQENRDAILSYPSFFHMDDFHTSNMMADGPELQGFVDLEMTRHGNEVLFLGAALAMMSKGRPERWSWIRRGYEDQRDKPLDSQMLSLARMAAPFSQWTRFMWYWSTDDLPRWAVEQNARAWPVRDVKAIVKTVESMQL